MNLQQGMIKDFSVKLGSIVACLLRANCKDNLATRFFLQMNKNQFWRPVNICWRCHNNGTYLISTIRKPKFVLLTCLLPFLVTKGSRIRRTGWMKHRYRKLCSIIFSQTCSKLQNDIIEVDKRLEKNRFCSNCEGCQFSCTLLTFPSISSRTEWHHIITAWLPRQFQNDGFRSRFFRDCLLLAMRRVSF